MHGIETGGYRFLHFRFAPKVGRHCELRQTLAILGEHLKSLVYLCCLTEKLEAKSLLHRSVGRFLNLQEERFVVRQIAEAELWKDHVKEQSEILEKRDLQKDW